jgi:alanine racemase
MTDIQHSIGEIAAIVKGTMLQQADPDLPVADLLTDSRRLVQPEGCLFFALTSKRNDGHRFIEGLYEKRRQEFCGPERAR